ncbi:hypothetical protein GCM10010341_28790 [Streptomyces noursei]|nr:hypothetical protein GCM10010341_28790 [Streptomyces noursei]
MAGAIIPLPLFAAYGRVSPGYGATGSRGRPPGAFGVPDRARGGAYPVPRLHLCAHFSHPPNERHHVPEMLTDLAARQ